MANPQAEDGHVDIANVIVEALARMNLSPTESRVLWALFRKTYGWHKKRDGISLSQFSLITGIMPQHVSRTIKQLEARRIIMVFRNGSNNEYQFQKNYEIWDTMLPATVLPEQVLPTQVIPEAVLPSEVLPEQGGGTTNSGTTKLPVQVLPTLVDTKENNTKEKVTKETIQKKIPITDKKPYGIDGLVKLTDDEYNKLLEKFGDNNLKNKIDKLATYIGSKGKKYRSHYMTILNWSLNDNGSTLNGINQANTQQNTAGANQRDYKGGKYGGVVQS